MLVNQCAVHTYLWDVIALPLWSQQDHENVSPFQTHALFHRFGGSILHDSASLGCVFGKDKLPSLPRVSTESFEVVKEADRTLCLGVPSFLLQEQTTENTAALTARCAASEQVLRWSKDKMEKQPKKQRHRR